MIRIEPDCERRLAIHDRAFLHEFLRGVFQQRRKLLRNVVVFQFKSQLGRPEIDAVFGVAAARRAARVPKNSRCRFSSIWRTRSLKEFNKPAAPALVSKKGDRPLTHSVFQFE